MGQKPWGLRDSISRGPGNGVELTLGLQLSEVTQDGAEGGPLSWFIGQALAGECGQLRAGGLRKPVLLLVETLFLPGRGPTGVSAHCPPPVPFSKRQSSSQNKLGPCSGHSHFTDDTTEAWRREADLVTTSEPGLDPKSS